VEQGFDISLFWLILAALLIPKLLTRRSAARFRKLLEWSPRTGPSVPDASPFDGRAHIIDGDTIEVDRRRVRMFGIDAPELSQHGGYKARSHLIRLAGGKVVRVHPVATDCYGRTVARVWYGDIDLSDRMVRDGFARATSRWNSDYDGAEFEARRGQRGLWYGNQGGGIRDPAAHRRWKKGLSRF
jgi:endonuclease YncB( thermonuclease family)